MCQNIGQSRDGRSKACWHKDVYVEIGKRGFDQARDRITRDAMEYTAEGRVYKRRTKAPSLTHVKKPKKHGRRLRDIHRQVLHHRDWLLRHGPGDQREGAEVSRLPRPHPKARVRRPRTRRRPRHRALQHPPELPHPSRACSRRRRRQASGERRWPRPHHRGREHPDVAAAADARGRRGRHRGSPQGACPRPQRRPPEPVRAVPRRRRVAGPPQAGRLRRRRPLEDESGDAAVAGRQEAEADAAAEARREDDTSGGERVGQRERAAEGGAETAWRS